jgi:hypothetical protein
LLDCCHAGAFATAANIPFEASGFLQAKPNRVIIAASHATQVSFLSTPVSLFTYALLEGLAGRYFEDADTTVTVFDLAMYVRERVYPLSRRQQQPQLNVLPGSGTTNFSIVQYTREKARPMPFTEQFVLLDSLGKAVDTQWDKVAMKDEDYRREFMWLLENSGDHNIMLQASADTQLHTGTGDLVKGDQKKYTINNAGAKIGQQNTDSSVDNRGASFNL